MKLTPLGKGLVAVLIAIAILVVAAPFVRNHLVMARELEPLRLEFQNTVADGGRLMHHYEPSFLDNVEYSYWEYDGQLDEIIKRRDDLLAQSGYGIIGAWYVEGVGKYCTFNCFYYVKW